MPWVDVTFIALVLLLNLHLFKLNFGSYNLPWEHPTKMRSADEVDLQLARFQVASQVVSWLALATIGLPSVKYVAAFFWLWALKNITIGPLKKDAGIVTFALVRRPPGFS